VHNIVFTGHLPVPVLAMHTTGDGLVVPENEQAYRSAVDRAGDGRLLRQIFVHRAGHCAFTPAETITAVQALVNRVDTGRWDLSALDPAGATRLAGAQVVSHLHIENHFRPQALPRAVSRTLDNATARLCARLVAVSDATRRSFEEQGFPPALLETVHNGIVLDGSAPPTSFRTDLGIPQNAVLGGYYAQAVNKGAPHPAAARLWEEFLYSDEGQNLWLKGGARPVRAGNGALGQVQRDELGELMQMCWRWCERGKVLDDEEWAFVASIVERAIDCWAEPDRGFWEWRGEPRHFVHSKAACWGAIDRGLALAESQGRNCPADRWRAAHDEIAAALDERGFDRDRGTYVQVFGRSELDAAALLLPVTGYVAYDDERMVSTVDAIRDRLGDHGLLRRYDADDGLPGREGAFLACSFWLADCLARQGRLDEARAVYDRVMETASPLGLFSEEADAATGKLLGNYPQGLTHLSHIAAALALVEASSAPAAR